AFSGRRLVIQLATQRSDQASRDRQAQAGRRKRRASSSHRAPKWLVQRLLRARMNSRPRVLNGEFDSCAFEISRADGNGAFPRELERVRHQVQQRPLQFDRMSEAAVDIGPDKVDLE